MKATLSFDLSSEEDKEKFKEVTSEKGVNLRCAMKEFSEYILRSYRKYGVPLRSVFANEDQIPTDPHELSQRLIEHVEKEFYAHLTEYGADLE